ncbi:MAG TPA: membrane protein insertase YidC [Woeseiaceae bacterium]|nr:membrane protein insertase YidC [Woeseiaceae bacterium]
MDNLRLFTWGLFAFLAFLTWQTWMEDYAAPPRTPAGSVEAESAGTTPGDPDVEGLEGPAAGTGDLPALDGDEPAATPAPAAGTAPPDDDETAVDAAIIVRTDVLEVRIDPRGGALEYAELLDYPVEKDRPDAHVVLLDSPTTDYGRIRSWLRGPAPDAAPGPDARYTAARERYELDDGAELVVPLTWRGAGGVEVEKRYVFRRGQYTIGLEHRVTNGSTESWRADAIAQIQRRSYEQERSMFDVDSYSFDGPQVYTGEKAEKLQRDDLLEDGPYTFTTAAGAQGWVAAIQHHFLSAVVPAAEQRNLFQVEVVDNRMTASVIGTAQSVEPGASAVFGHTLFVGPKLQDQLALVHDRLKLSVDYGLLTPLAAPMFLLLSWVHDFVGNWGWAIIIVTVLIKLAFYKLTAASGRSMAKIRELQPRMKALQDRYKDDRQALSQAMMELYKREKVNPAAGCLPILIQMPFFLAFYWVLVESVEMRQAPFALWVTDLSSRDPYFILPLIMGAAMLLQTRLNPAPADPVQARVMQIMPIVFTAFFAFFPAGLVLYWVTNTLLSIAQQWRINKLVHAETVARKSGQAKKGRKAKAEETPPD